jgi:hypothetical protein
LIAVARLAKAIIAPLAASRNSIAFKENLA